MSASLPILKCKIKSNAENLNILNQYYNWIPNESMFKPTDAIRQNKNVEIIQIENDAIKYPNGMVDYIYETVFKSDIRDPLSERGAKLFNKIVFEPNKYPYQTKGKHYVLWFGSQNQEYSDECITDIINKKLNTINTNNNYDFVWYKNPKMSVPKFFHVQVFWIKI